MRPTIRIDIYGPAGSGKTKIAKAIAPIIWALGFRVELREGGSYDPHDTLSRLDAKVDVRINTTNESED